MRRRLLKTKHQGHFPRLLQLLGLFTLIFALPSSAWGQSSYFGINTNSGSHWVTDNTANDVLEDGSRKINYDVDNNILTLNGIDLAFTSDISYDAFIAMVDQDHPTLTVRLVGDNTVTLGNKACFFNGWGITFTTDASNPGSLTINTGDNWSGALFIDNPTSQSMNATYSNGLSLTKNGNTYTIHATPYNITVAGTAVTSANAANVLGDGTVTFTPASDANPAAVLTLNGASITPTEGDVYGLLYTGTGDLTISLNGTNTIKGSGGCNAILYDGAGTTGPKLTFTNGGTEACSLLLETTSPKTIDGFGSIVTGEGLFKIDETIFGADQPNTYQTTITSTILGGGSGTASDPILIKTKEDVRDFARYINSGTISSGASFQLDDNIDCDGLAGYAAAGSENHKFGGVFDGNKKTISNLTAQDGLFYYIDGATIKDLTLSGCTITGATSAKAAGIAVETAMNASTTIQNCSVVNSTIACKADANNPIVGGIVAQSNGITITGCTIDNVQIKAETTYASGSYPQGVVGGIVGNASGGEISSCVIKNGSKITDYNANENAELYAGTIVGDYYGTTLSANYYYYDVTVETLKGTNTDNKVTKSDYIQRGTGHETVVSEVPYYDVTNNNGAVMYTKPLTVGVASECDYYEPLSNSQEGILALAPGQTVDIDLHPADGKIISAVSLIYTPTGGEEQTENLTNIADPGYYGYSFTMPDAEATLNITYRQFYNLWIGETQVTSDNAANVLGDETGSVSFSATAGVDTAPTYTLTLNGATITGPVKVGLPNLTVDVQGTNSITVPEGNVFKLENDETNLTSNVTCVITFKTSTADGKLTLTSTSSETIERGGVFYYYSYNDYEAKFDINIDKTIGLIQPTNSYYLTDGSEEYHVVRFAPSLGVSIGDGYGGTKVITEDNAADVFEDGTVSFDKTKNILTLNGASLSAPLSTSLATLTVDLIGENTLRNYYDGHVIETPYGDDATVNIKSTAEDGSLTMTMSSSQDGRMVSEHVNLDIADPLTILSGKLEGNSGNNNTVVIGVNYHLTVAGVDVTSLNKDKVLGDDKITFTPSSNTLNLNGATIEGSILYDGEADLTIALNSVNSVTNEYGTYAIYTNGGNFIFMKADGATSAELTATCGNGYTPISTYVSTLGSGLYWKPVELNSTVISDDPQFVIVDGLVMTDDRTVNGSSGTITYNSTDKILTLTGFIKEFGTSHAIKTGVSGLKVKLVGESRITCLIPDSAAFYAFHPDASIQFVKNEDDNTSKLTMSGTTFEHFGDNSITYYGLVYYSENNIIAIPVPPSMEYDNSKVELKKGYDEGIIYYTITYADGKTEYVSKTEYTGPFEMKTFGTVEAWVEANGATTSTVKGKYFGYKDEPYTMKVGDTKTTQLIPAIEETDYIVINNSNIEDDEVATFSDGVITAIGIGSATLETDLGYNDRLEVYILNPNNKVTAEVNVGVIPNITFTPDKLYATFCNTGDKDLTVPEGLTAYAITGTNEDVVTLSQVEFLPKLDGTNYVALLLKRNDKNTEAGLSLEFDGTASAPTSNLLRYAISDVQTTGMEYVLYKDEFVKAIGTILTGKCYLDLTGVNIPSGARSLGIDSDGTTGINRIDNEQLTIDNDVWYDLRGRRIEKPTKDGLYIKNGKKIVVNNK